MLSVPGYRNFVMLNKFFCRSYLMLMNYYKLSVKFCIGTQYFSIVCNCFSYWNRNRHPPNTLQTGKKTPTLNTKLVVAALFLCLLFLFDWFVCFFVCPIKCPCLILLFAVCMIVFRLFTVGLFAVSLLFVYFSFCLFCSSGLNTKLTVWSHCFLCLFDRFVCFFACPIKCPCLL